jgi:tetrapyrrole methylase family protein/MazG family protein
VVAGLGPGGPEYVTQLTVERIAAASHRFLRTCQHPSAHLVPDARSFDHVYETASSFDEVYRRITDELVAAAAEHGEVLYAVPGSPLVLERSVAQLLDDDRVEVEVLPAMSFLDLVWARLRLDPVEAGVRLVDGHTFATSAAGDPGPLLVAHCHADWVLSEVKLAVEDAAGDEEVVILQRLGTPDEAIVHTTWAELDRTVAADHLTTLYVPALGAPVGRELVRFHELARTLRERCPWDREQTHRTLVPYLLEETYEVADAIAALDPDDPTTDDQLVEELGDLLYQIEFHAAIGEQEGRFTMADIARGIHAKLVRRHPHVFGDGSHATDPESLVVTWEAIKRAERAERGQEHRVFDGVPAALPSLAYAAALLKRAAKAGFPLPDADPRWAELDDIGAALWSLVVESRRRGVDPEVRLREVASSFRAGVEAAAARRVGG